MTVTLHGIIQGGDRCHMTLCHGALINVNSAALSYIHMQDQMWVHEEW